MFLCEDINENHDVGSKQPKAIRPEWLQEMAKSLETPQKHALKWTMQIHSIKSVKIDHPTTSETYIVFTFTNIFPLWRPITITIDFETAVCKASVKGEIFTSN